MSSDGWFPIDRSVAADLFRERSMRAVKRVAGSDEETWIDLPRYGQGHIAVPHLYGSDIPITLTMWMDDSKDRVARIIKLGPQRLVVELHRSGFIGVLEDPTKDNVEQYVSAEECDVLGHDAVAPAQIIIGSITAESQARVWLDCGAIRPEFRIKPWPTAT